MTRICANPNCGKEVNGRTNKIFCGHICRTLINQRRENKKRSEKRVRVSMKEPLLQWKQHYILNNYKVYPIEQIAKWIKKPVEVVKGYCESMGLEYFSDPFFTPGALAERKGRLPKEETKPVFQRPPAIYPDSRPVYKYENYKERLLCR